MCEDNLFLFGYAEQSYGVSIIAHISFTFIFIRSNTHLSPCLCEIEEIDTEIEQKKGRQEDRKWCGGEKGDGILNSLLLMLTQI